MQPSIDPKELKTLSDILALVLEDQAGQSSSALEALRARARRNAITGGALKNLFVAIANDPPPVAAKGRTAVKDGTAPKAPRGKSAAAEVQAAHVRIAQLAADVRNLDLQLRTANASAATLQAELDATRQAYAHAQSVVRRMEKAGSDQRGKMALVGGMAGGGDRAGVRAGAAHGGTAFMNDQGQGRCPWTPPRAGPLDPPHFRARFSCWRRGTYRECLRSLFMTNNPKIDLANEQAQPSNAIKDPSDWTTGGETMTGAQASYLKTLCEEAGQEFDPSLSKADASKMIDSLRGSTGRGVDH